MSPIATARTAHGLNSLDIVGAALRANWRRAEVIRPDEELCGAARLQLAHQFVSVRLVVDVGDDMPALLDRLRHDVLHAHHTQTLEFFIIMVGSPYEVVRAYRDSFTTIKTRRVTVGSWLDYLLWVEARLGPLGRLPVDSKLRLFAEHMLCANPTPEPKKLCAPVGSYEGSDIQDSFEKGQVGVQLIQTLLEYTRGKEFITNVEGDRDFQLKDIDLRLVTALSAEPIDAEAKYETPDRGNFALELWSRYGLKIPLSPEEAKRRNRKYRCEIFPVGKRSKGWFQYSEAGVLITILEHTGDVLLMNMAKVQEWIEAMPLKDRPKLAECTSEGQDYYSQCYIVNINYFLTQVPESVHLRLQDWLPTHLLDKKKFTADSFLKEENLHKTLRPLRLAWPV